jgi:hypothetical protein
VFSDDPEVPAGRFAEEECVDPLSDVDLLLGREDVSS